MKRLTLPLLFVAEQFRRIHIGSPAFTIFYNEGLLQFVQIFSEYLF